MASQKNERVTVAPGRTVIHTAPVDPKSGATPVTREHGPGAMIDMHPDEAARLRELGYLVDSSGDVKIADGNGPNVLTETN